MIKSKGNEAITWKFNQILWASHNYTHCLPHCECFQNTDQELSTRKIIIKLKKIEVGKGNLLQSTSARI